MLATFFAVALFALTVSAPNAGATGSVGLTVIVNGRAALESSDAQPVQLVPSQPVIVEIEVTNHGGSALHIRTVRFEGDVLDLPLFSYDSAVVLNVPAGATRKLTFPISMTSIGSQATGLIVASVSILGASGATILSQTLVTKVHGSLTSLYGLFGLVVLVLTVSSLLLTLLALARQALPQNRWRRAVRFFIPGFGVGLVLIFTMSAFGIFAPGPGHWVAVLVVASVIGFAIGYLTPAPTEEPDDYEEGVLMARIVVVDEDPLEAGQAADVDLVLAATGAVASGSLVTTGSVSHAPDGRATSMPSDSVPDSRATSTPTGADGDSVTRPSDPAPDSRPTLDPE